MYGLGIWAPRVGVLLVSTGFGSSKLAPESRLVGLGFRV